MIGIYAGWACVGMLCFLSVTPAYQIIDIVKTWQITHAGVCAGVCVCLCWVVWGLLLTGGGLPFRRWGQNIKIFGLGARTQGPPPYPGICYAIPT